MNKLLWDLYIAIINFQECILGLEFAGICEGRRVMGLVPAGGLATCVRADPLLTWDVPDRWSLKDAATLPVVYATVRHSYCYTGLTNMQS